MKIYIGSDHAGFELKGKLIEFLKELGHEVEDKGAFEYNQDDDYPDFVTPVAEAVSKNPNSKGLVIGKSGQGEAICANRIKGVRAVVFYGPPFEHLWYIPSFLYRILQAKTMQHFIELSRMHNDANVLSLGAECLDSNTAFGMVGIWLNTAFSGDERHVRRIEKLDQ